MTVTPNILGVILAGGRAQRFFPESASGGDKGLASIAGEPMLAHVIARFRPQVARLIISANGDPDRFKAFGLPVVEDRHPHGLGPLAGIQAAMDWHARHAPGATAIATVTTDVPFLPLDLVQRLSAATRVGPAIAVSEGRRHPTIALWPVTLREEVDTALTHHELSLNTFAHNHGAFEVAFPLYDKGGEFIDPFFNANTQEELAEAHRLATRAM
jgi:molybdopterin-guanine dinucleotide biosynthesis protein A